ncbi:MAG: transketolase [Sediminispirochaetaceae bacterium]
MNTDGLTASALSVRALSMDAVQAANSGHPGLPMGCAEIGSLMYGEILKHAPHDPEWIDRDRFVLSAGHGSMLLYSLLHLSGYDLALDEIKKFRQIGSKCAGHPEYGLAPGVETTTGPLGAGFSNAVGMAIAETHLAEIFNTNQHTIIDHYTYALAGDGCLMEGISSEAASLAGHLGLGKLIVMYDSNSISIEGSTSLAFSENVAARFKAYGWQVLEGDAYNFQQMSQLIQKAQAETEKPSLIILTSIIGKGSPNKAGTHGVHGAPLGEEEVIASRRELGIPEEQAFFVHPEARNYFKQKQPLWRQQYVEWEETFKAWANANPDLKARWDTYMKPGFPQDIDFPNFGPGDEEATRKVSGAVLQKLADALPNLVGGSADLAPSNNSELKNYGHYSREDRGGRNFHFGVREHAMGGITNGIALHGGLRPFAATFLVFSDYMRPAIRLAALMKLPVIYIFTHDSIYIGEDGPTHQPVEQLAALRAIPALTVLRPGDPEETVEAWKIAVENKAGPTALVLTRQKVTTYPKADPDWSRSMRKGAYLVKDCDGTPDVVLLATGSEIGMALEAAGKSGKRVRVISIADLNTFLNQDTGEREADNGEREADTGEREALIPSGSRVVVVEAGISAGWGTLVTDQKDLFTINRFGESGPGEDVAAQLGFTVERLVKTLQMI